MRCRMKKGDKVMVIAGSSRGHVGEILAVLRKTQRVIVSGARLQVHHQKPSVTYPEGGLVRKEGALHISNVMLVDPEASQEQQDRKGATRVGIRIGPDGQRCRYAKRSGSIL